MSTAFLRANQADGGEWISVSDMMAGLMVLFLFIAISYMMDVREQNKRYEEIADTHQATFESLYSTLLKEFKEDLPRWSAHLDSASLSIRFTEPDVLFDAGRATLKPEFKEILDNFFPRYIAILRSAKFADYIAEVRIEGHTSSEWQDYPLEEAYFCNMDLSQKRTRAVLQYVMGLEYQAPSTVPWLRSMVTANGLSSSKIILDPITGEEDKVRSRRVEFRVRTNAEDRIHEILQVKS